MSAGPRVLFLTPDRLASHLAGPAIRFREMARGLAATARVTLASPLPVELETSGIATIQITHDNAENLVTAADVLVVQGGQLLVEYPELRRSPQPMAVDLYDPRLFEGLHLAAKRDMDWRSQVHRGVLAEMLAALERADLLLVASRRQELLYRGMLSSYGNLYQPPICRVRCGIAAPCSSPASPTLSAAGFRSGGPVILWAGGLWDWTDPLTAIRAFNRVIQVRPDAQLVLWGARSPHPQVAPMEIASQAVALAQELGLAGRNVHFDDWVSYDARIPLLQAATIGISLAPRGLEDHFAHRTRLLDFIGAGAPVVTTAGDGLGRLIRREGLGITVRPGRPQEVAQAILALLDDPDRRRRISQQMSKIKHRLSWERAIRPLQRFVAASAPSIKSPATTGILRELIPRLIRWRSTPR